MAGLNFIVTNNPLDTATTSSTGTANSAAEAAPGNRGNYPRLPNDGVRAGCSQAQPRFAICATRRHGLFELLKA